MSVLALIFKLSEALIVQTRDYLSPIIKVLAGTIPGCLFWTISNMNLLGLPSTTGSLPEAVLTAATMDPVPLECEC